MTLSLADAYNLLKRELSCAVLHITSGDSLAMSFQASGLPESGDALLPFREAMCSGLNNSSVLDYILLINFTFL